MFRRSFFFFKQKTAYEMRISDWSSDVCSSDLRQMLGYVVQRGLPAHVLLTKADKLGRGAAGNTLQAVRRELSNAFGDTVSVQTFSGESKQGEIGSASCRESVCQYV